jgi:transposase InsO family protein
MVRRRDPGRGQTWRTFIKNHAEEIFACDFLVQYTARFDVVYVFVVMQIASRRIVHFNVTAQPSLEWVKQQIRNLAPHGSAPRFLIHDNDGIFGQLGSWPRGAAATGGRRFRCHLDRWLKEVMGIEGIPIPYGAPNANAHVERFHRTLREGALRHFIFWNEQHVRRVCTDFIAYYNGARPSQATHAIPAPYPELTEAPPPGGKLVALPVLGGIQHDYRLVA